MKRTELPRGSVVETPSAAVPRLSMFLRFPQRLHKGSLRLLLQMLDASPARRLIGSAPSLYWTRLAHRPLQFDRTWKEDIVFEMNVLMQVLFEFLETSIQRLEARTGVFGRRVSIRQPAHGYKQLACIIVVRHHSGNRKLDGGKASRRLRPLDPGCSVQLFDVGKQHALFLEHMGLQFLRDRTEEVLNMGQFLV